MLGVNWQGEMRKAARRRPEVEVWLEPHDHGFRDCRIAMIRTAETCRGRGLASAALRELCRLADHYEVWLHLTPDPVRRGDGMSKWSLVSWYKRHGFERNRDLRITDVLSRPPGKERS